MVVAEVEWVRAVVEAGVPEADTAPVKALGVIRGPDLALLM
jgi:hypothetical protein